MTNKIDDTFHIYDSLKKESFQIVGKSKFIDWLNDHASAEIASTEEENRYLFFSTHDELEKFMSCSRVVYSHGYLTVVHV
jgi:hypothetical protein|tara:strand:- start:95 stop:334 length:240 start_codon:yes stop_codon:yes gene_type:complete